MRKLNYGIKFMSIKVLASSNPCATNSSSQSSVMKVNKAETETYTENMYKVHIFLLVILADAEPKTQSDWAFVGTKFSLRKGPFDQSRTLGILRRVLPLKKK